MPRAPELSDRVAARIREEILAGKWATRGLPSERELSEIHGVARLTVRRGLKRLCAEHLIEPRPGRGYVITAGAAALHAQPQGRAVFFFYVDSVGQMSLDPIDAAIMNGASNEARSRGLELYATCQELPAFKQIVRDRMGRDLRGILLDCPRPDLAEFLLACGVPFVVVQDDIEGLPVAAVVQDNAAGSHTVLEHMGARGHRRIGLIVNSHQQSIHPAQRLAAYREFMLRSGTGVRPELIAQDESNKPGARRAAARLLDLAERPTAIYVAGRGMLDGVIEELASRGIAYPRDISLATWGEPGTGEPAGDVRDVTYVAWDRQDLGRMAILTLEERIRAGRPERMVFRIAARIVDCGSVAAWPG